MITHFSTYIVCRHSFRVFLCDQQITRDTCHGELHYQLTATGFPNLTPEN